MEEDLFDDLIEEEEVREEEPEEFFINKRNVDKIEIR